MQTGMSKLEVLVIFGFALLGDGQTLAQEAMPYNQLMPSGYYDPADDTFHEIVPRSVLVVPQEPSIPDYARMALDACRSIGLNERSRGWIECVYTKAMLPEYAFEMNRRKP